MDKKVKLKALAKQQTNSSSHLNEMDDINENDHQEVDKRLKIYQNMREEILRADSLIK